MFKARVKMKWSKRTEVLIANNKESLALLLSAHNNKPRGKGYCRVEVLEIWEEEAA